MKSTTSLSLLLSATALAGAVVSQSPVPVLDINTTASGFDSNVDGGVQSDNNEFAKDSFVQVGSHWYFIATSLVTGTELWKTDGTAAGTTLVKDINPGTAGSSPTWLTSFYGGLLAFQANDGVNGSELWVSDGTAAGTMMVANINPTGNANPAHLTVWNGKVWFAADDGVNGTEMWSSDLSGPGTSLFADLRVGASSIPQNFTPLPSGALMVFRCNDGVFGTEPWVTDGTLAGTALLADLNVGTSGTSSTPDGFVAFGGNLYFAASGNPGGTAVGVELWKTDGSTAGTTLVADIRAGSNGSVPNLSYAVEFAGELYFVANDGTNGTELWKTDGTTALLAWDVATGSGSSSPSDMHVHNGALYFTADDNTVLGRELRRIDVGGATSTISDLTPGTGDTFLLSNNNLMSGNGLLYFKASNGSTGYELGISDGTPGGTMVLADLDPGTSSTEPDWFTVINATQVMFVADTAAIGQELWVTDGTATGTGLLTEIDATILTADGQPEELVCFNGRDFLFQARTDFEGEELWKWDPNNGASMVLDIRPGASASNITNMTYAWLNGHDVVLFSANDGTNGTELWITDGTAAGTQMVADIWPGSSSGNPANLIWYNGLVYFSAFDGVTGNELWATDGTTSGTFQVADIQVGPNSSAPQIFCVHRGLLYFRANDGGTSVGGSGNELWVTDGTPTGTHLVADINPSGSASTPSFLTSFGDKLVFTASNGTNGTELWMSDGTTAGTMMVDDIAPGSASSTPQYLTVHNGELFFRAANSATVGTELWKADAALTTLTPFDLNPGTASSNPSFLTSTPAGLFFNATDGSNGLEPWISDGTAAGTHMVADINTGTAGSSPDDFTSASDGCYFSATTVADGNELWFTDGTAGGTHQVADIFLGPTGSNPTFLKFASGQLFFQADDEVIGKELFVITSPGASVSSVGVSGDGTVLSSSNPMLGQPWSWSYTNAPQGGVGIGINLRVFGLPIDAGSPFGMTPISAAWVDFVASPVILEWGIFASGGGSFVMPSNPALTGARLNLQSLTMPPSVLPFSSSNGLTIVLGS